MSEPATQSRLVVISKTGVVLGLFALAVHLGALWLFDVRPADAPQRVPAKPFLSMQAADNAGAVGREQASLLDTAPLFLPTQWNTALAAEGAVEDHQDPNLFEAFPEEITLDPEQLRPVPKEGGGRTLSLLDVGRPRVLDLIGKEDYKPKALPPRTGLFEIRRLADGSLVASGPITENPDLSKAPLLWQAAEFLVRVIPEGVLGSPFQSKSSGSEEIDDTLRSFVMRSDAVHALSPGYYSVVVGP